MSEEEIKQLTKVSMQKTIKENLHSEMIFVYVDNLEQENKQLKEQLENKIDLYEDTISYQLGFDKGKEYMQQRIDKAIEYMNSLEFLELMNSENKEDYFKAKSKLLEILGDKE